MLEDMPNIFRTVAVLAAIIFSYASLVHGQCAGPLFVRTPAEAYEVAVNCSTIDGSLYLVGGAGAFNLSGLIRINGSLSSFDIDGMTQVTASDLRSVSGSIVFGRCKNLERFSFPALSDLGSLTLWELPKLAQFVPATSRAGVEMLQNVSTVSIRETGLSNLDWLRPLDPQELTIIDNINLSEVSFTGLYNSSANVQVGSNLTGFVASFPQLRQVQNLTVYGAASVDLPALELVNRTLALVNNTAEEFNLPRLREVREDLVLDNNSESTSIKVPVLTSIGRDVTIRDNARLEAVNLPVLESVKGDLWASGSLTKLNFDSLTDVQGDVSVSSTGTLDCATLDKYDESNVFKARYTCSANSDAGEPADETGSGGLSSGAKAGIAVGVVVGVALLASAAWVIWRKTSRSTHAVEHGTQEWRKSELPADAAAKGPPAVHITGGSPVHEMSAPSRGTAAELDPSIVRHELAS